MSGHSHAIFNRRHYLCQLCDNSPLPKFVYNFFHDLIIECPLLILWSRSIMASMYFAELDWILVKLKLYFQAPKYKVQCHLSRKKLKRQLTHYKLTYFLHPSATCG